jgi:hypothetical protein
MTKASADRLKRVLRAGCWAALLLHVWSHARAQQTPATEMDRAVDEFKVLTRTLGIRADSPPSPHRGFPVRRWHGRIFENFRNDFLDAVPHEIVQRGGSKSVLRRNQFGFSVAGPLVVPRLLPAHANTFLSLSYEGARERISRTYLRTIPTVAQGFGDYSDVVDDAGNPLPIYDPASTRPNPAYDPAQPVSAGNLQFIRDPFPNNRLPADRLDPVALKAITFYPAPNAAAGPFFRNNYFINSPEANTANGMISKLDQAIRDGHHFTVELAFSNGFLGAAKWFPTPANPGPTDRRFQTRRGSLEHVFTASSRTVNTATFEASSQVSGLGEAAPSPWPVALGLAGVGGSEFPVFSFSPYLGAGKSYPLSANARNRYVWTDGLSTRRGKHNLRLVAQYALSQVNTFWPAYPSGRFDFSAGVTSLPGIINTGDAFASFLLGLSDFAQASIVQAPSYFRRNEASVSVRDRYELGKRLTINIGLSFERITPRVEKYDRQSTIDLAAMNPGNGRPGALAAAARSSYGRAFQPVAYSAAPSLSLTWNPLGNANTVVRAAFARSYSPVPIYTGQWGTQGFSAYPTLISPNVQLQPAVTLSRGLPRLGAALPDVAPDAANNTVADLMDPSGRLATYQSVSLSIERQLPGALVLGAGASYSGGKNLAVGNAGANPNAIPLDALAFRDLLNDEDFNRSLRPYPQYKGFDLYSSWPAGRYQRDAAFLRVEKRVSRGLALNASYEFGKQMDDYSGPYGTQDFFNRANEWALTPEVPLQRLQLSYVYELPLGNNKPLLNFPDWRKHLVDGWSVSGMALITGGTPIYLRPEFNNTGGVVQALHVNVVPGVDPHVSGQGPAQWFNPAAFDQPPDFSIGDASRTLPNLLNPGFDDFDISINKRIPISPDRTLEFSAEGFNFLNHANWNEPDNVIGPASAPNVNAGKIIGSRGGRVIQISLRFSF